MKNILVTGSIAYDHLMTFDGFFKETIIPEELHALSISFLADKHSTFFGGCATNIAFSLKKLGAQPVILGVAGNDFDRYEDWLKDHNISTENIHINTHSPTAVANILSDKDQNQIAVFSPAAMKTFKRELLLKDMTFDDFECAIIGPEMPKRMMYFSKYFQDNGLKYLFDPGQVLHALSKDDLEQLIAGSFGIILNEYEAELLHRKTGITMEELAKRIFVIKTLGENGCEAFVDESQYNVAAIKGVEVVDATGCGDGFRSGFLYAYIDEKPFEECLKFGNVMASFVLENIGTQNYSFDNAKFEERLRSLA